MKHEVIFTQPTGRQILVIIRGRWKRNHSGLNTEVRVLIREAKEEHFHVVIGPSHPKHWKIQSMSAEKVNTMQIRYSGISAKQIRKARAEFDSIFTIQNVLNDNQ